MFFVGVLDMAGTKEELRVLMLVVDVEREADIDAVFAQEAGRP